MSVYDALEWNSLSIIPAWGPLEAPDQPTWLAQLIDITVSSDRCQLGRKPSLGLEPRDLRAEPPLM
jgi:hypothetical protein